MSDYACVRAGNVVNIIVLDNPADPIMVYLRSQYDEIVPLTAGAGIGWTFDGTNFQAPPLPIPAPGPPAPPV